MNEATAMQWCTAQFLPDFWVQAPPPSVPWAMARCRVEAGLPAAHHHRTQAQVAVSPLGGLHVARRTHSPRCLANPRGSALG